MKQQQRMKITQEMTRTIRAKGSMDANNSWWVSDLLVADCEKAWLHERWEDTDQKWRDGLHEMNMKDEVKKDVEGSWAQNRLYDIAWPDEKKCRGCNAEEGPEKHRLCCCPCWKEVGSQIPEEFRKWEQRARSAMTDWKLAKRNHDASFEWKPMDREPLGSAEMGVREAQKRW